MIEHLKGIRCPFTERKIIVGSNFCNICTFMIENSANYVNCNCGSATEFSKEINKSLKEVKISAGPTFEQFIEKIGNIIEKDSNEDLPLKQRLLDSFLNDPDYLIHKATNQIVSQIVNIGNEEAIRLGKQSFRNDLIDNVILELQKVK